MDEKVSLDLDAYSARYVGRSKIVRLRFIASRSAELECDALRLAIDEAKKGLDTVAYRELVVLGDGKLGKAYAADETWVAKVDQVAMKELEKLRNELEENKQQSNKEVIRTGHNDLGDFFHMRGKLEQARGDYIKTRDYCMHAQHTVQMCMKVIRVIVEAGDFAHVESYYMTAENTPDVEKMSTDLAKMRAAAGLALLVRSRYSEAAARFLTTNTDASEEKMTQMQREFGDVMSLEDVATYGGLCALATLDRASLKKRVIDAVSFRNLLELVPDIREIIYDFYSTRYTRCLETLERVRGDLMLDLYLGRDGHVDRLYRMIRQKALVQYVSPFLSADLVRMQAVFKTGAVQLEQELLALIESGAIQARIDTQKRALYSKQTNMRLAALSKALRDGREAFDDAEAMVLRMALSKHDLKINGPSIARASSALGARSGSVSSVADNVFGRGGSGAV